MYVIISTSGLDITTSIFSEPLNKSMILLNKKPIISYILDELYSYMDFVDKIFIVGNNLKPIENFFKFDYKDEFFKTKIYCLKNEKSNDFETDFYSAVEYITDNLMKKDCNVLLWRADELVTNTKIFKDYTLGSFRCCYNNENINVYKLTSFPDIVNNLLYLKENNQLTMDNFLERYKNRQNVIDLSDEIIYYRLKNDYDYYKAESSFINKTEHENHFIKVSLLDQSIRLRNKYKMCQFSRGNYEKSRKVEWDLWSHYNFLEYSNNVQQTYLPNIIDRDIDIRGEYTDEITVKWIPDSSLRYMMLYQTHSSKIWHNIINKVCYILANIFHKKEKDYHYRIDESVLEQYVNDLLKDMKCSIPCNVSKNDWHWWMELYDDFAKRFRAFVNPDTAFYNGTDERLVHGDLSLDNVKCSIYTGMIHFVNPFNRLRKIVNILEDYSSMLVDSYCIYPIFETEKYISYHKHGLDVPDFIADNSDAITTAITNNIPNYVILSKEYALFKMLQYAKNDVINTFLIHRVREILHG